MSLIAWLPLTTDIKEKIQNRPVTAAAGRSLPTTGAQGKLGQGYTFSGSGVEVSDVPATAEMSFSLWLKMTSNINCHILDLRTSDSSGYQPIYYKIKANATDGGNDWGIQIHSAFNNSSTYINYEFKPDVWYNVIVIMKHNEGTLYVNGEKIGTASGFQTSNVNNNLSIGCRYTGDNPFPGIIQDVRIYNHILSKKEIKDLNQALVLHYNFENANVSPNLFVSDEYINKADLNRCSVSSYGTNGFILTCTESYIHGITGQTVTDPYMGTSTYGGSSVNQNPILYTGNAKSVCISWTHVSGLELNKNYIVSLDSNGKSLNTEHINFGSSIQKIGNRRYAICSLPTGTKAIHVRFGNNDLSKNTSITVDEICVRTGEAYTFSYPSPSAIPMNTTGLYNTTNCQNLSINNDAKQGFYSGKFNNTIIQCPFDSNGWEEFTLAAWVKPDTLYFIGYSQCFIVGGLYLCMENEGQFSTYCYGKNLEGYHISNSKLKAKEWNHIAAVWSKSDVKLYLNGNLDQTINNVTGKADSKDHHIKKDIGAENNISTRAFLGLMDDVRIYASALSENDIQSLIHTKQIMSNHGYEYVSNICEQDILTSQVTSKSIHNFNGLNEILELNDGSCWIQLSHHDCQNGNNLFEYTDDFSKNFVYHNDKCWSAFHLIDQIQRYNDNNYEFMSIENVYDTENIVIRKWRQTVSPLVATHNDVAPNIKNNGYMAIENMPEVTGGLRRGADHQAYFKLAIADQPDYWYGAFGCYSINNQMPYQQIGIPTVRETDGTEHITGGLYDLYMRIDPTEKRYREFKNGIIMPTTINEI